MKVNCAQIFSQLFLTPVYCLKWDFWILAAHFNTYLFIYLFILMSSQTFPYLDNQINLKLNLNKINA